MLNVFYWYSIIWGSVLILYNLGWSDLNSKLDVKLSIFLWISIITCLIFGTVFRDFFKYRSISKTPKRTSRLTIFIIVLSIIEFIYARDIPIITIPLGLSKYSDFSGLPIVHVFVETAIVFYSSYLFYIYLETKQTKVLLESMSLLSMLLLMFHKGPLVFSIFIITNLYFAKKHLSFDFKKVFLILMIAIIISYANGVLSNIRNGVDWNDYSYINSLASINDKWPDWISHQFCWVYSYITSPLANLNLNIVYSIPENFSFFGLLISIIPLFISKRVFPSFAFSDKSIQLYKPALNATTGYIDSILSAGIVGLICMFIVQIMIVFMIMFISRKYQKFSSVYNANLSMLVVFMFFYNTFTFSGTSLIIPYIIFLPILIRVKVIFRR